jgi:uncharacterized cofD-like protein
MVKLIIYDLDDTLYDCSGKVMHSAMQKASSIISKLLLSKGIKKNPQEILKEIYSIYELQGPQSKVFNILAEKYFPQNKNLFIKKAMGAYNSPFVPNIRCFPFAISTLKWLKKKNIVRVLVSYGNPKRQLNKIKKLGLKKHFDEIFITENSEKNCFADLLKKYSVRPSEAMVIGDKIFSEIASANKLGITSVQYVHGRYKNIFPKNRFDVPDYKVNSHNQIELLVEKINSENLSNPKIVVIGGGTGLPRVLSAMKKYTKNITGIVTVMDSGRSSGKIREEFDTIAFGDLRNCLSALSNSTQLQKLFQYRFKKGSLNGHSLGNLFLFALSDISGSHEKAIEEASNILEISGEVIPSTYNNVHVCAELVDGKILKKETDIVYRKNFEVPIKKIFLTPKARASKKALQVIQEADLIVIGPGGWYTSVISNLCVNGIASAIKNSSAKKIVITNIMSQPGQTHNYKLSDYLKPIHKLLKQKIDFVIYNNKTPSSKKLIAYAKDNSFPVQNNNGDALKFAHQMVGADLIEDKHLPEWGKPIWLRHDSEKIAKTIMSVLKK